MTGPAARARPSRRPGAVTALALSAVALLAGCSSDEEPAAAPAPSAAATPAATAAAETPACPDGATLAAVSPDQAPGVQLTDPTCSGPWAVIGLSGPTVGPVVQVFRYADGAWAPADRDAVCTAGELPADIQPGVCQAG
jgi:hypothetical protein